MAVWNKKAWTRLMLSAVLSSGIAVYTVRGADKPTDKPADKTPAEKPAEKPATTGAEAALDGFKARMEALNLTEEQKGKVAEILKSSRDDIESAKGDPQKMRQVMMGMREKVQAILTDEQKAKMDTARPAGGVAAGRGMMLENLQKNLDKLDLTSEQKEKLKPVMEDFKKKFDTLRGELSSTTDRAAMREKYTAFMDETRDKLKAILTEEQAAKLKAMTPQTGARPGGTTTDKPATEKPATEKTKTESK